MRRPDRGLAILIAAIGAGCAVVQVDLPRYPPSPECVPEKVHCVSAAAGPNQEFATIQAAVDVAVAGDTVLVFDGRYRGFVVSRGGSSTAPVTVKANGKGAVVDRPSSAGEGIRVDDSRHVVIEGFTVTGISGYGIAARGARATSPMRGVVFRNNTVRNCGGFAGANIYASQAANSLIEGNESSGSPGHGIYLANAGSDNTTLRGNLVHGNGVSGIHVNGDASVGGDGIVSGAVVEGNTVHGNVENGLNLDGIQASTIRNNVIYGNGRHGIRAYRIDAAAGPRDLVLEGNTVIAGAGGTAVKLTQDLGGHAFFDNVLVNEGTSGGTIIVGHATFRSDRNTFVNPGFSLDGGNSMITLAQWRALAGAHDAASRVSTQADLFVAPGSRDYRLRAGS